jgi:hypothetical protein
MPTATAVNAFASSVGVNTHLNTSNAYSNMTLLKSELSYLGVNQIRDNSPTSGNLSNFKTLAAAGIKLDLVIGANPNYNMNTSELQSDIGYIDQIASAYRGSVLAVEGLNEPTSRTTGMVP